MRITLPLLFGTLALLACSERAAPPAPDAGAEAGVTQDAGNPALRTAAMAFWRSADTHLTTLTGSAEALKQSVDALLAQPDDQRLAGARSAWHNCHRDFLALSLHLATAQAHPGLFATLEETADRIDGWPIQPGFLDYYDVYTQSGLVNDIAIAINARSITEAHQQFDRSDRALGFHAMAYLLWGENGNRAVVDFALATTDNRTEEDPAAHELPTNRRRALLALQANLLQDDILALSRQWGEQGSATRIFAGKTAQESAELLRSASIYLIEQILIDQQLQSQLSPEEAAEGEHNRFANAPLAAPRAQLQSLEGLLAADTRPLLGLWSQGAAEAWVEQLAAARRSLEKLDNGANETQWVAAIASLQQLAQLLKVSGEDI